MAQKTIRKKEEGRESPGINTSSLPDVVFMILFFFMVTTSMRETTAIVKYTLPVASEIVKLENKSLVSYIYVGPPTDNRFGDAPRIQLNDSFSNVTQIGEFIAAERDKLSEIQRPEMTVSLRVDVNTRMGMVTDIKQALRRANALRISYAATKTAQGK